MENQNEENLKRLNKYGILGIAFFITLISICGFLTNPLKQEELLIFRASLSKNDWPMTIGKIILCLTIIADICVFFNIKRMSFFNFVFNKSTFSFKE